MSLAKNIEFLRRLPKLNALNGFGGYGRNLRPGVRSPLVETTDFGSNPGALRMFSFVPGNHQQPPALVVVLHGCGQSAAGYDLGAGCPSSSPPITRTGASTGLIRKTPRATAAKHVPSGR